MQFQARVEHLSSQGLGSVRDARGQVYFVRGVWPGDEGLFAPGEEREGRYQFAQLVQLISPSPDRREPPCPHFGVGAGLCYGCPWMIANESAQARQKLHRLRYAFERVGLDSSKIQPLWEAPSGLLYRSRAQFKTDGVRLGYAGLRGESIADVENCQILSPGMQNRLHNLRARLPNTDWTPGPNHLWNFLEIDESRDEPLMNRRLPFAQAHAGQNQRMKAWVRDVAGSLDTKNGALELFAGSGNFTVDLLAAGFERVAAFEVGADAVEELKACKLPGVTAERLDLYKPLARDRLRLVPASLLFANPPRAGLMTLTRLVRHMPELRHLIYVSCEIETLVSDLQKLKRSGFQLHTVQPVDQMPQTPHLEVLVRMDRLRD